MADRFVLTQPYHARPYAIGAALDLIGAVLLVVGIDRGLTVLIVIALFAFALGTAIMSAAALVRHRLRTVVELTDHGLTITSGGRQASAKWSDISGVTTDRRVIYLDRAGDESALRVTSPRGIGDPHLTQLAAELTRRLDDSRGYRRLS